MPTVIGGRVDLPSKRTALEARREGGEEEDSRKCVFMVGTDMVTNCSEDWKERGGNGIIDEIQ